MRAILCVLAVLAGLLTTPTIAQATVRSVPPGTDASYDAAYQAAAPGDVLELQSGQYGTWTVPAGTKQITVRAGLGTRPVFKQIANYGNCAPIDGSQGADNITFDGLTIDAGGVKPPVGFCALFENGEHNNVTFKNGDVGNTIGQKGMVLGGDGAVVQNVNFHDVYEESSATHNECIWASSNNQKILDNHFGRNCGNTGPLVFTGTGTQYTEFSGNTFDGPQIAGHAGMIFGSGCGGADTNCAHLTLRNNTFTGSWPNGTVGSPSGHTYNGSVESCNTPGLTPTLPGITHETCGSPDPTPTPTPTPTPSPTPSPTPTPTPSPTPSPTPTPSVVVGRTTSGTTQDYASAQELDGWTFTASNAQVNRICAQPKVAPGATVTVDLAIYNATTKAMYTNAKGTYTGNPGTGMFCVSIPLTTLNGSVRLAWLPRSKMFFQGTSGVAYTGVYPVSTLPATWPSGGGQGNVGMIIFADKV